MLPASAPDFEKSLPRPRLCQVEDEALDPPIEVTAGGRRPPVVMDGSFFRGHRFPPSSESFENGPAFLPFFHSWPEIRRRSERPASPADLLHLFHTFLDVTLIAGDLVLLRFTGDRPPDEFRDLPVGAPRPKGTLEVRFVVRQQAGPKVAVRRQAEAVAGAAEMAADGTDETDLPRAARQAVDPRRAVAPVSRGRGPVRAAEGLDPLPDDGVGEVTAGCSRSPWPRGINSMKRIW